MNWFNLNVIWKKEKEKQVFTAKHFLVLHCNQVMIVKSQIFLSMYHVLDDHLHYLEVAPGCLPLNIYLHSKFIDSNINLFKSLKIGIYTFKLKLIFFKGKMKFKKSETYIPGFEVRPHSRWGVLHFLFFYFSRQDDFFSHDFRPFILNFFTEKKKKYCFFILINCNEISIYPFNLLCLLFDFSFLIFSYINVYIYFLLYWSCVVKVSELNLPVSGSQLMEKILYPQQ